jgi:uncharacterized protein YrrD
MCGLQPVLRSFAKFQGSLLLALDGEVCKVRDLYFDDVSWVVRYFVVDTGRWLSGRKVLISPLAVKLIDRTLHTVSVSLTRARIEASPNIDSDKPVSRLHESEFNTYYGYTAYWARSQWGIGPVPPIAVPSASDLLELEEKRMAGRPPVATHLRSTREVRGYSVSAIDGIVGQVEDFLFDDETWVIRYLVVKTGVWLFGRHVLLSQDCVQQVDWAAKSVEVCQPREQIEHGREFDHHNPPPGDFAKALRADADARHSRQ